ncbi:DUF6090 family protein [Mangrovimonas sp. ST2L15]|uniref:DUF6090 family protein n=1 Tax=Mangrovimonas sp. ST2L15 TaxID=1645916 RepID=UPI0006B6467D|nr:DUF6090 family protein [Mangrovimonas sp. ST2L15]
MIKLFRNIRKTLLYQGRTGKYMKYAIGEIILVVIGILIALQVNNWNESRKNNKLRKDYSISVINDIEKDSLFLNRLITQLRRDSTVLKSFQARLQASEINYDSIIKLYRYEFPFFVRPDYSFNNTTLINLIGNNSISYPKDLRESMTLLVKVQKDFERTNELFIDKYFDILHSNNSYYPFENYFFDGGKKLRDTIWSHVDTTKFTNHFHRMSDWKKAYTEVILRYALSIQEFSFSLKKELQNFEKL